jgi:carnitine O-acetyltransferase
MTAKPRSVHFTSADGSSIPREGNEADPKQGAMLRYQASLPHLPVPSLASTLSKYLDTIRPHLTSAEYARSESTVRAFGASAQGQELQRRLEARRAVEVNWLADFWNETAYMAYREPVVVNVSYFYVHVADEAIRCAPKRAATLLKALLSFRTLVETCVKVPEPLSFSLSAPLRVLMLGFSAQLEPDKIHGTPLCMDSYKWL